MSVENYYKKAIDKAEKEVGKKYNRLTITGIDYNKTHDSYLNGKYRRVYVYTKCECGKNPPPNQLPSIKSGHIKSCGCSKFNNQLRIKDLTGLKFGRLTVLGRDIERDDKKRGGAVHWLCQCDCGSNKKPSVVGYQLTSGRTLSCGCYASEKIKERNQKYSTKTNRIEEDEGKIYIYDEDSNRCIIDKEDYETIKQWYWKKIPKRDNIDKGYWVTNTKLNDKYKKSVLLLHQVVANIKYGEYDRKKEIPDHLSRDTDDNRKCNTRLKTNIDNSHNRGLSKANTSGKTGVYFSKSSKKWIANITVNYKKIKLGTFLDFEDAVKARLEVEEEYGFTCDKKVDCYDEVCQ